MSILQEVVDARAALVGCEMIAATPGGKVVQFEVITAIEDMDPDTLVITTSKESCIIPRCAEVARDEKGRITFAWFAGRVTIFPD